MNKIYEYEEISDENLKTHIIDNKSLHSYFELKWDKLKAKQYCGVISCNSQNYFLLPKISKKNEEQNLNIFIYMLMFAYDIKLSNEDIASCANKEHGFLEVLIQLFARSLLNELKKGIYKEYITISDNLSVLKGKYLVNENLKYNFTKAKIYCEYDEFSPNNSLNQFFLFAIKTLKKYAIDKRTLTKCELIFDEVEVKNCDVKNIDFHFNRLNLRFKTSFEIALLLLKRLIPLMSDDKKSFAYLFDMNTLFERFIAKIVKSINPNAKIQNSDSFGDLTLKPDIILDNLIIDTKYKKLSSKSDIKQNDKLQAFAYGVNYKLENVMLLYPKHLRDIKYSLKIGKEKEINLKIDCIDLDYNGDYDKFITIIINRINI